jgi:hypothetical protein
MYTDCRIIIKKQNGDSEGMFIAKIFWQVWQMNDESFITLAAGQIP